MKGSGFVSEGVRVTVTSSGVALLECLNSDLSLELSSMLLRFKVVEIVSRLLILEVSEQVAFEVG